MPVHTALADPLSLALQPFRCAAAEKACTRTGEWLGVRTRLPKLGVGGARAMAAESFESWRDTTNAQIRPCTHRGIGVSIGVSNSRRELPSRLSVVLCQREGGSFAGGPYTPLPSDLPRVCARDRGTEAEERGRASADAGGVSRDLWNSSHRLRSPIIAGDGSRWRPAVCHPPVSSHIIPVSKSVVASCSCRGCRDG